MNCRGQAALAVALAFSAGAGAQDCVRIDQDEFLTRIATVERPTFVAGTDAAADSPRETPNVVQTTAPAAAPISAGILSGADFTSLAAMALENGLLSDGAEALTFDLNLFAIATAFDPAILHDQALYEQFTTTRRFGGAVSFGGKGEKFDQDGDGDIDEPKDAASHSDIVTWEVRYRLWGSHDRRDRENYSKIYASLRGAVAAQNVDIGRLNAMYIGRHPSQAIDGYCSADVDAFLQTPQARALTRTIAGGAVRITTEHERVLREIDNSLLVTLAFGGTQRKEEFGADNVQFGVRAARGWNDGMFSLELDYAKTDEFRLAPDIESTKLALAYSRKLLRGHAGSNDEGISFTLALAWEKYRNVAGVAHDDIAKANIKFSYPIAPGVEIPLSVTWANHEDLITDEEEVRGHIGFTFDMRKLFPTTGS